jgi:hypothetical protein
VVYPPALMLDPYPFARVAGNVPGRAAWVTAWGMGDGVRHWTACGLGDACVAPTGATSMNGWVGNVRDGEHDWKTQRATPKRRSELRSFPRLGVSPEEACKR